MTETKTPPYLLISDTHYHPWQAFASQDGDGVNTRLRELLDETLRAAQELKERGGKHMIHAGDVFHVRGMVSPVTLNAVRQVYEEILSMGIDIYAISGNHDLEWDQWAHISSAVTTLGNDIKQPEQRWAKVKLIGSEGNNSIAMFHWQEDLNQLVRDMIACRAEIEGTVDAIIHAPVDGVLPIPGKSLDPIVLSEIGFNRVFAGHYHNHKDLGGGVYSIGALSHYTWSDVGSKPGYLFVYPDRVEYRSSRTPRFVDCPMGIDDAELLDIADGNYVRFATTETDPKVLAEIQNYLKSVGKARAVQLKVISEESKAERTKEVVSKMDTIETAISKYAESYAGEPVRDAALEIYQEVLSAVSKA
jgi:DNA repair exonuclease SbcCD nuclease subunit